MSLTGETSMHVWLGRVFRRTLRVYLIPFHTVWGFVLGKRFITVHDLSVYLDEDVIQVL